MSKISVLPFEGVIQEIQQKIEKLQELKTALIITDKSYNQELVVLEKKLQKATASLYSKLTPSQKVMVARHPNRPYTLDYIKGIFTDFCELHGDRLYGDDSAIVGGIAKFNGASVMIVGHQKGRNTKDNIVRNFGMAHPEGYRKAIRLFKLAEKFKRPIITFVDTAGAYPGLEAEERGQAEAIARSLFEMSKLQVPLISFIVGEGGSGGALGIAMGNSVYMLEHSIYSVISPEGCASILWKDQSYVDKASESLKLTANDLLSFNVIDGIITEPVGGAHRDYEDIFLKIKDILVNDLEKYEKFSSEEIVDHRYNRFRSLGVFGEL